MFGFNGIESVIFKFGSYAADMTVNDSIRDCPNHEISFAKHLFRIGEHCFENIELCFS